MNITLLPSFHTAIFATLLVTPGILEASVLLDFQSLATSPDGGLDNGFTIANSGFLLTAATPDNRQFTGWEDGWQFNRGSSNGTTYAGLLTNGFPSFSFLIESTSSQAFDFLSIDLAEIFNNGDFGFSRASRSILFQAQQLSGGTVSYGFSLDLVSDGTGGAVDFESVLLPTTFRQLSSVTITASSGDPTGTYLAFDNISLQTAVPEPSSLGLVLVGVCGAMSRRRRK